MACLRQCGRETASKLLETVGIDGQGPRDHFTISCAVQQTSDSE